MHEILELVDLDDLREEVRGRTAWSSKIPRPKYHFNTGRAHALRLGYPASRRRRRRGERARVRDTGILDPTPQAAMSGAGSPR